MEIVFDERRLPWTLAIEPWAEALDVPARTAAVFIVEDAGETENVRIGITAELSVVTVGTQLTRFSVEIAGNRQYFDFG